MKIAKKKKNKKNRKFFIYFDFRDNFNRGNNFENKIKINCPLELNLSQHVKDKKFSPKFYNLVGIIKRYDIKSKEHYISIIFNTEEKCWYVYDDEKKEKIEDPSSHKNGDIVMLFLYSNKVNN